MEKPEEFMQEYGYYPGRAYAGGEITEQATRIEDDRFVVTTPNGREFYSRRYYRLAPALSRLVPAER